MTGKEVHSASTVQQIDKLSLAETAVPSRYRATELVAQPVVDPLTQLQANVKVLRSLTSELSFMVREIGTLTKKV